MSSVFDVWCGPGGTCLGVGSTVQNVGAVVVLRASGSIGPIRSVRGASALSGITCHESGCIAVGRGSDARGVVVNVSLDGIPGGARVAPGADQLFEVACATSTTCLATGSIRNTQQPAHFFPATLPVYTVIVNGQPAPATRFPPDAGHMVGIDCPTATTCLAVGGGAVAVLTNVDGTWSATLHVVSGPSFSGYPAEDISCGSPTVCYATAVGFVPVAEGHIGVPAVVAVTPTGAVGPVQHLTSRSGHALAISCVSSHTCTVVGQDNTAAQGLVVDLVRGHPAAVTTDPTVNLFRAVSCVASATCGIAGYVPVNGVFAWHGPIPG